MTPRTTGPARRYGSWVGKSEEGKVRVRGWAPASLRRGVSELERFRRAIVKPPSVRHFERGSGWSHAQSAKP